LNKYLLPFIGYILYPSFIAFSSYSSSMDKGPILYFPFSLVKDVATKLLSFLL